MKRKKTYTITTREEMQKMLGERVYVTAIKGRASYAVEKISSPKIIAHDVEVQGIAMRFDHVWIEYIKELRDIAKNRLFVFQAKVISYLSMDEKGSYITKYGLDCIKYATSIKDRAEAKIIAQGFPLKKKKRKKIPKI